MSDEQPMNKAVADEKVIEAEYTLESNVLCPNCQESLDTLQVVRMLRTKVNFVSGAPRRAQLLICPLGQAVLAGNLGGLL